ncbi:MAG TPA: methyltransferase domain-containing protein [Bacteroidia bacterium]|nr:methyltransferase domain-containing protein [Bacteroidia bacterium]
MKRTSDNPEIKMMFENYPKKRTELPEEYRKIYSVYYKKNREGKMPASSLSQRMEAWLHRKVAGDVSGENNKSTLEIGAGTLNQLKYEQTKPYDIVEPFTELYSDSEFKSSVREIFQDIRQVNGSKKYDRITSIATFEHITNLPEVVARTCILLNENGCLRVSIPNEGTFLWTLGWRMTTGLEFKLRYGLDYRVLMNHEHVNTADEIETVLNYFYATVTCSCFGINKRIALYRFYECTAPRVEVAEDYLKTASMR